MKVLNQTRDAILAERAALAATRKARKTGLLRHDRLPDGEGLVIAPCGGIHTFGMKFAIDAVFYDRSLKVRKIRRAMPKSRICFSILSKGVIELPAGVVETTGTQVGDQRRFDQ